MTDFYDNVDDVFVSNCLFYDDDFPALDISNENCTDYLADNFEDDFWDSFNYDDFIYWDDDFEAVNDYISDCIENSFYLRCYETLHPNAIYSLLAVYGVATILLVVVVLGLLIPLFIQLKNGTFYQERSSRRSEREPPYSTYNLYLVYSALADLFYVLVEIISYAMDVDVVNGYHWLMVETNLWINAAIVYEVLVLLRASKSARRINQPSLTKVNLQVGAILVGMILYGVLWYLFPAFFWDDRNIIQWLVYFIPILYVIGVTIFVKCKAYLPPSNGTTPRDKAVRGLALFFFRVSLIMLYIWIPYLIMKLVFIHTPFDSAINVSHLYLPALQPIANFCLILSKPDVKKYIINLVTLSYIFGDSSCCSCNCIRFNKKKDTLPGDNANQGHGRRGNSTTILGYTFSGVDDDDDDNDVHNIESDSDVEEIADDNNFRMIEDGSDGNNQEDVAETGTTNVSETEIGISQ